jgi:hypothetical protein
MQFPLYHRNSVSTLSLYMVQLLANLHTLLCSVRDLFLFTEFYLIEAHLFFITRVLLYAYIYTQNNLSCSAIVLLTVQELWFS